MANFTFGEGDNLIATINGKQNVYLNAEPRMGSVPEIELPDGYTFQQVPNKNIERDVLYISAMSGSGKTFYTAEYVKQYHKAKPKNDVFLFSSIDKDKSLDSIKCIQRVKINDPKFIESKMDTSGMANSLLIFDDVDVLTDKHIKKAVFSILDSVLQTGRHFNISVIFTSHNACSGNQTKVILNESTSITLFPKTSGNKSLNYISDAYLGLDKKQAADLKKIKGRWVTIIRAFPRCIMTESSVKLI